MSNIINQNPQKSHPLNGIRVRTVHNLSNTVEFEKHWSKLIEIGGPGFTINPYNNDLYGNLLRYFNGQPGMYDLKKGLIIYGGYGVGKSMAFSVMKLYMQSNQPRENSNLFKSTSTDDIIEYYRSNQNLNFFGWNRDTQNPRLPGRPINLFIDEFTVDRPERVYGVDIRSILINLMMLRYEVFIKQSKLTHLATNLNPGTIGDILNEKLADRFIEMFNFIELKGTSFRK
jgi:hypothetical protein